MSTILVKEGTLRTGGVAVAGEFYGKVRAMLDDKGRQVKEAGPSTPVEVLGLDGVPLAGETLNVASDAKQAIQVVEHRREVEPLAAVVQFDIGPLRRYSKEALAKPRAQGGA